VHLDLARVERELGDRDGEWHALEQGLRADPRSVAVRQEMSRILLQRGRAGEAAALLEEAVRMLPRSAAAHASLAQAYDADGRTADAIEHWRRVAELDADGPFAKLAHEALARSGSNGKEQGR
jgi:tetratricopeptide (TPR) repeat protein